MARNFVENTLTISHLKVRIYTAENASEIKRNLSIHIVMGGGMYKTSYLLCKFEFGSALL